jgi:galactokinase
MKLLLAMIDRVARLKTRFKEIFGEEPAAIVKAPGRINLIGEHTDYNEGFVLPVAINRNILIAVSPRKDRLVFLHALDFEEASEFSLDAIERSKEHPWSNYQRGVAYFLKKQGFKMVGMNACITGDVPIGSGLSSSAAVEVATAYAWKLLSGFEMSEVELALLCQRAENDFVGMRCGIMDQFASTLGRRGHALLIDCRSLNYEFIPIPEGVAIVVADTMVRRDLVESEYNIRRMECEEGVRVLRRCIPGIKALRDVSVTQFEAFKDELPQPILRRCRHVVYENERVLEGVTSLRGGDLARFGELMKESHASLRDDYEVSCRELDLMVEAALEIEGVYGSRLVGAGFGGCTISLMEEGAVKEFISKMASFYEEETGIQPQIYACRADDGVGTLP